MKTHEPPLLARCPASRKNERGVALLISVFVLMLVGAIGVAALNNSENEAMAGGRTRGASRALYAADAGIQLALARLSESPPNLAPIDIDYGRGGFVQSRTRSQTAAQPLGFAGSGAGADGSSAPPEGYALPSGSGGAFSTDVYQINITASADGTAVAEVEARLGVAGPGGGGY